MKILKLATLRKIFIIKITKMKIATPEQKIVEIKKDLTTIEKKSEKMLVIRSEEDVVLSTEFLSQAKARADRIEEIRLSFTKPINAGLTAINKMYKEPYNSYITMMQKVKRAIGDYRLEEERKAQKEEERLEKVRDEKNKRNEEKGKAPDITPVKTVERPETVVKSDSGKTTTIKVWKFEIEDVNKLPESYKKTILDFAVEKGLADTVIRKVVNAGIREIEGVRIYEDIEVRVSKS